MNELEQQVQVVARARQAEEQLKVLKTEAYAKWLDDNKLLIADIITAEQLKINAENRLRAMTLEAYEQTKNKAPAPGVGIRIVTELVYNPEQAFDWAKSHSMALKLDVSAFEKIAKAAPMEFVKTVEKPTATIATKLEIAP